VERKQYPPDQAASNENPLGPSPRALEAIARALSSLPSDAPPSPAPAPGGRCRAGRGDLVGNGSNEIIGCGPRADAPGDDAVMADQPS
jgi:histidinol-phosphate aminotransferase